MITELSEAFPDNEYEKSKNKPDKLVISSPNFQRIECINFRPSNAKGQKMTNQAIKELVRLVALGYFCFIGKNYDIAT